MKSNATRAAIAILSTLGLIVGGCADEFWDPSQVGRFRPVPAVNVILDSLGVAEETPVAWETGEEPRPADAIAYNTDYVFGSGDILQLDIFELFNEGQMYTAQFIITETGRISIPDVGVVDAAGLTEGQLEEQVKQILAPHIIREPSVKATLLSSQSRVFSVIGNGVTRPARYPIPRYDYRLTDALASAGGIGQFNISYIYVSRPITGEEPLIDEGQPPAVTPVVQPEPAISPRQEMMEVIAPLAKNKRAQSSQMVIASAELATDDELSKLALPEQLWQDEPGDVGAANSKPATAPQSSFTGSAAGGSYSPSGQGRIEWVFRDGKWVPVQVGVPSQPAVTAPPARTPGPAGQVPPGADWDQVGATGEQLRVIRIPADRLLSGEPRYNIVIRPGDAIHVPVDIIGEFCIMGNVNRTGFVPITGRPMTLKMAIASAGGLGPLAWPKRCEVVRRIGKKREEIVMVDLDKIARGEQPDFFIKPNDLINVGTHPTARFRAVLRNAFRATYGFGFIYDRNFADRDFQDPRTIENFIFGSAE